MDWPQVSAAVADTSKPLPDTLSPSLYRLGKLHCVPLDIRSPPLLVV